LEQIHNCDLIHCDIHSGNILAGVNGVLGSIRIADLGLCKTATSDHARNNIYGVPPYVAPEIFRNSPFTKASD
ncbi:11606_t:CDS:1, partial [Acaulospora colombiana]